MNALQNAKTLVIKVGSSLVTNQGRGLDVEAIARWAAQIARLRALGRQAILVSSGAIAEGMQRLGWTRRPHAMHRPTKKWPSRGIDQPPPPGCILAGPKKSLGTPQGSRPKFASLHPAPRKPVSSPVEHAHRKFHREVAGDAGLFLLRAAARRRTGTETEQGRMEN